MTLAHRLLLKWARTLHVYLTLFGYALLLFFAVTGFMLNHEEWFLPAQSTTGKLSTKLLESPPDRDTIIEVLQNDFGVQGDVEAFDFAPDKDRVQVVFRYNDLATNEMVVSKAVIMRSDGSAVVTVEPNKASREHVVIVEGTMPLNLLTPNDKSKELPIVERLRKDFGARGEVQDPPRYESESESFGVVFKAPGYAATATIRAGDGHTKVVHQSRGINGILLDLHRGKESGLPWSVVIDAVSILFVIVSITGLILWSSLKGRAQHGLAILILGLVFALSVYWVSVPR